MRRVAALRDLSDDHHSALVIARRCKRATGSDGALWQRVREAFAGHLEPHFQIEDRHLLPALEASGEARLADRIRADHAELRALASEVSPAPATIQRFGDALGEHVRFEEREVFEATQARLPESALQAIAEACRSIPRVCPVFD